MDEQLTRKMIGIGLLLAAIFAIGTLGYILIEGQRQEVSPFDAFYMTVITLTTIGFGEIPGELSMPGRVLTIFLALSGMGTLLYSVSNITAFVVEGHLKNMLSRRKMNKMIDQLRDHYIVCGCGLMAQHVCEELSRTFTEFVIVEEDEEKLQKIAESLDSVAYKVGDVSDDEVLLECGVERARGLISVQPTDQDNLFTIITARRLNPDLRIISVAIAESSVPKLRYAGADGVVSPNFIGSMRMVSELIRPATVGFLDRMLRDKKHDWRIGEAIISENSGVIGKNLRDLQLNSTGTMLVLAVQRNGADEIDYVPSPDTQFADGDILFVLAPAKEMDELRGKCGM